MFCKYMGEIRGYINSDTRFTALVNPGKKQKSLSKHRIYFIEYEIYFIAVEDPWGGGNV